MVRAAKNIALGGVHDVDLSVFRRRRVALAVSLAFGMGLLGDDACAAELDWLDAEQQAGAEPVMHMAARATTEPAMYMAARATTEPVMHVAARTATDPAVVAFNPRLFAGSGVDLSRFAKGNPVEPGNYAVDVSVNGKGRGRHDVLFRAVPGSDVAMPCFSLAMLKQFGVDGDKVASRLRQPKPESDDGATAAHEPGPEACLALREAIPDATYTFNSADLKIDLTIPQTAMSKTAQGYVDPSRWDEGINVGLLQYNVNGYTSESNFYGHNFSSLACIPACSRA